MNASLSHPLANIRSTIRFSDRVYACHTVAMLKALAGLSSSYSLFGATFAQNRVVPDWLPPLYFT